MAIKPKTGLPAITLVGSGNLAQALGPALRAAGHRIQAVVFREADGSQKRAAALARKLGAKTVDLNDLAAEAIAEVANADVVWLCHTDDALPRTAALLANRAGWKGKIVFHSSGALTSDVLQPLRRAGAHAASLHPMMTFVPGSRPKFEKVAFAAEGDRLAITAARRIVSRLGGEIFEIKKRSKVLYHALGSFSSPLLVATLVTAERVASGAGLSRQRTRKLMAPILRQTLANYLAAGAAASFSGPIKRGDLQTIRRHLRELKRVPGASEVYRALARSAIRDLPAKNVSELIKLLAQSTDGPTKRERVVQTRNKPR